jgi:hypothetical protein
MDEESHYPIAIIVHAQLHSFKKVNRFEIQVSFFVPEAASP